MTKLVSSIDQHELMLRVARAFLLHEAAKKPKPLPSIFDVDPEDEAKLKEEFLQIFDEVEEKAPPKKPEPKEEPLWWESKPEPQSEVKKPAVPSSTHEEKLWDQFLEATYGKLGGKTLIKNTNPETKDKYPKVQVNTLLKSDQVFAKGLQQKFELWKQKLETPEGYKEDLESAFAEVEPGKLPKPKPAPKSKKEKEKAESKHKPEKAEPQEPLKGTPIEGPQSVKVHDVIQWDDSFNPTGKATARVVEPAKEDESLGISFLHYQAIDPETGKDVGPLHAASWQLVLERNPQRAAWKSLSPAVKKKIKELKSQPVPEPVKLTDDEHELLRAWGAPGSGMYELGMRAKEGKEISKELLEEADKEVQELLGGELHSSAFEAELKKIDQAIKKALPNAKATTKPKKPKKPKTYPEIKPGDKVEHPSQLKEGDWVTLADEKGNPVIGQVKKVHSTSFEIKDYKPDGTPYSEFEDDLAEIKLKHLTEKANAKLTETPDFAKPKKANLYGKTVKKLTQLSPFDAVNWHTEDGKRQRGYVTETGHNKVVLQPVTKSGKPQGEPITITDATVNGGEIRRLPSSQTPDKLQKYIDMQKDLLKQEAKEKPVSDLKPGDKIWETNQNTPMIVKEVLPDGTVSVLDHDTPYHPDDLEKMVPFGGVLYLPPGKPEKLKPADEKVKWVSLDPIGNTSDSGWETFHPPEAMGGATPGVFYQAPDGKKYYVKIPNTEDHVRSEILAAKLYEAAGIKVPELNVVNHNGQMAIASRYIPGFTYSPEKLQEGGVPQVAEGFATDAWLANWDVVGKGDKANNMPIDPEGDAVRVDMGGALMYHGGGEKKEWSSFPEHVEEIEGFQKPHFSKSKVYKNVTDAEIADSIQRVLDIPEDTIEKLVDQYGPTSPMKRKKLLDRLLARRKDLAEQQKKYKQKAGKMAFLKQAALWKMANSKRPELPETFFMFLRDAFGPKGGQEKVRNTNPETKDKYEQVQVFTLMRTDDTFRRRVLREYKEWEARRAQSAQHFQKRGPEVDVDAEGWRQVGHRGGSNPGGFYEGPDGDQWYVKTPKTPDHANNEILAGEIYRLGGVEVPEIKPAKRHHQYSVASKIVPGLREDEKALTAEKLPEGVAEGMAMDAWLANWDVVGLTYDNLLLDEDDKAHRVDVGGALRYRAMGSPKGDQFGDDVTELGRMLNPQKKSGSVFSNMTDQQVIDSIQKVLDVDMEKVRDLIAEYGPPDQGEKADLFETLKARREHLAEIQEDFKDGHGSDYRTPKAPPRPQTSWKAWRDLPEWMDELPWSWEDDDE